MRQLAVDYRINPLTVSRAYQELDEATLVEKRRGLGLYVREGARELIATAVVSEIFDVMKQGQPYNAERFKAALARLPRLPWEPEE